MSNYGSGYFQVSSLTKSTIYSANDLNLNNSADLSDTSFLVQNGTDEQLELTLKQSDNTEIISLKNSGTDEFIPTISETVDGTRTAEITAEIEDDNTTTIEAFGINFKDADGDAVSGDLMNINVGTTTYTLTADPKFQSPMYSLPNTGFGCTWYYTANVPNNADLYGIFSNTTANICDVFVIPQRSRIIATCISIASSDSFTDPTGTITFRLLRSVQGAAATEFYTTGAQTNAGFTFRDDTLNSGGTKPNAVWTSDNLAASEYILDAGDLLLANLQTNGTFVTGSNIADIHTSVYFVMEY